MPRKNAEHDARLVLRLPRGMHAALKWTAEHDKLPLSDWVRNILNKNCYDIEIHDAARPPQEVLMSHRGTTVHTVMLQQIDGRPLTKDAERWRGRREDKTMKLRSYTDVNGDSHLGSLPPGSAFDTDRQDMILDRREARRELTTWFNRWGRQGKTLRLDGKELRLAQRLLASLGDFDAP